MGMKKFKHSKYVTYHDLPKDGVDVEIIGAGTEVLRNYQTEKEENFVVLEFKEFKPLVCKNPVLDALEMAFPNISEPQLLVGHWVHLYPSDERVGGDMYQLARIDGIKSIRADAKMVGAATATAEPARLQEEPPAADPAFDLDEPTF